MRKPVVLGKLGNNLEKEGTVAVHCVCILINSYPPKRARSCSISWNALDVATRMRNGVADMQGLGGQGSYPVPFRCVPKINKYSESENAPYLAVDQYNEWEPRGYQAVY